MATVVSRLEAVLTAETRQFDRAMRQSQEKTTGFARVMGKAKLAAIGFGIAGVGVATKFLLDSVKAAERAQVQQASMQAQLKALHISWTDNAKAIEDNLTQQTLLTGFQRTEQMQAFTQIVRATKDVNAGLRDTALAADIARGRHIDLNTAALLVSKVVIGNTGILRRYGIEIAKGATATQAMGLLQARFSGQAEAYGKTTAGAQDRFRASLELLQERLGAVVIPELTRFLNELNRILLWSNENWPKIRGTVHTTMAAIGNSIRSTLGGIVGTFQFFSGVIHGDWAQTWEGLKKIVTFAIDPLNLRSTNAAKAVWRGFIGGITGGAAAVKNAITGLFGKVIDWVKGVLGIHSPSAVFHAIGQNSVRGFVDGVGSMAGVLKRAVVRMAEDAAGHLASPVIGIGKGILGYKSGASGVHASPGLAKSFALNSLHRFGWGPSQMPALISLWNGESGWRWNAENASSGAYGIPQSLPGSKMASAGPDWRDNAFTQILWGLNYIKGRYGSPTSALSSWSSRSPHWYARGGLVPGTGASDSVPAMLTPGEIVLNKGQQALLGGQRYLSRVLGFAGGGIVPQAAYAGGTIVVQIPIDGEVVAEAIIDPLQRKAQVFQRRNGRSAF